MSKNSTKSILVVEISPYSPTSLGYSEIFRYFFTSKENAKIFLKENLFFDDNLVKYLDEKFNARYISIDGFSCSIQWYYDELDQIKEDTPYIENTIKRGEN